MYRNSNSSRGTIAKTIFVMIAAMLLGATALAQLEVGPTKMNLDGSLGFGYSGSFGNFNQQSSHGYGLAGNLNLRGYYFHPNFLSFEARPYFDRDQANSDSQIINRGSGFTSAVNLFGGSNFPGSVSYGQQFNSESEFRVAGVPSVSGDGSGQQFAINWSELKPNWPKLFANYYMGSSSSTVYGSDRRSDNATRNFTLNSTYGWAGWDLQGNLNNIHTNYTTPEFLTPTVLTFEGGGTTYNANAQHRLPFNGSVGLGWSHSSFDGNNTGNSTSSSYTAGVGFTPWSRLTFSENLIYTTNLMAAWAQSLSSDGSIVLVPRYSDSNGYSARTFASYHIGRGLSANGYMNYRRQIFQSTEYSDQQYGGGISYNKFSRLFGFLNFGVGMVDTMNQQGNTGLGMIANVGASHKFGHWDTTGDFSYSQNAQTLVSFITTSTYNYGATVRRRITRGTNWSMTYRAAHTGMTVMDNTGSGSQTFSSTFSWHGYSFSGGYSMSDGSSVFNSNGTLTQTPIGSLLSPDFILFNAHSYNVGFSKNYRKLSLSGSYAKFQSDSAQRLFTLNNNGDRYYGRVEYRLRKFSLAGGYTRAAQEVSTIPGGPRVVNSYYASLSRWFNIF